MNQEQTHAVLSRIKASYAVMSSTVRTSLLLRSIGLTPTKPLMSSADKIGVARVMQETRNGFHLVVKTSSHPEKQLKELNKHPFTYGASSEAYFLSLAIFTHTLNQLADGKSFSYADLPDPVDANNLGNMEFLPTYWIRAETPETVWTLINYFGSMVEGVTNGYDLATPTLLQVGHFYCKGQNEMNTLG